MFNDLDNKNKNQPVPAMSNLPPAANRPVAPVPPIKPANKIEDIFSETDKVEKPAVLRPKESAPTEPTEQAKQQAMADIKEQRQKIVVLAGLVIFLLVIVVGGFFGFNYLFPPASEQVASPANNNNQAVDNIDANSQPANLLPDQGTAAGNATEPVIENNNEQGIIMQPARPDSDNDGLSDGEETALGTNPNNVDSDSDGLFDREEVKVYQTNPLSPDTDGDGFLDGAEVKAGYNPNGPGKLFEVK